MKHVDPVAAVLATISNSKPKDLGAAYPELGPSVAKYRRIAAGVGSVAAMSREDRHAYGAAIEKRIRALQIQELHAGRPAVPDTAADRDVGATLRAQHRARLTASIGKERRERKPEKWKEMYEAAMEEKRKREAAPPVVKVAKPAKSRLVPVHDAAAPSATVKPPADLTVVPVGDPKRGPLQYIVRVAVTDSFATFIAERLKCRHSRTHKGFVLSEPKYQKFQQIVATL